MLRTKKDILSMKTNIEGYLTVDAMGKYNFSRIVFERQFLLAYESWLSSCDELGFDFTFAYVPGEKYDTLVGFSNFEPLAMFGSKVIFQEINKKEENYEDKVRDIFNEATDNSAYIITSADAGVKNFMKNKLFGKNYTEVMVPLNFFENDKALQRLCKSSSKNKCCSRRSDRVHD